MAFDVATMTLKKVGAAWVVDPVTVRWRDVQCFSYSGNLPLSGNGVPIPSDKPFSFGPCRSASGGRVRVAEMMFDAAYIPGWHDPPFDDRAKVILEMEVDGVGLQALTVNLQCTEHASRSLSALAREVIATGAAALSAFLSLLIALARSAGALLALPFKGATESQAVAPAAPQGESEPRGGRIEIPPVSPLSS